MIRFNHHKFNAVRMLHTRAAGCVLLLAAALVFSACFGGGDEPQEAPQPPAASEDPQPQPAAQQAEQPQQPEPVNTTEASQNGAQQAAAAAQPEPAAQEHVVAAGETLGDIAYAYGVRIDDLIKLNNIQNPNLLRVGQVLQIPSDGPPAAAAATASSSGAAAEQEDQEQAAEQEEGESVETPTVSLPNTALGLAAPTSTSSTQFIQPGPDTTIDTIPDPPANFIQYGVDALPWLQGLTAVDQIIPLFLAWPMPPLIAGSDRINLVDTNGDSNFSLAIIFTDPSSFGAAVPFSNLVVYDAVPGRANRYRIGYDHRLVYGREVQGLQLLSDQDLTGDNVRDVSFREVSCSADTCTSAFYILQGSGDGYRVITGGDALIDEVTSVQIADATADGVVDLIVIGRARGDGQTYSFTLTAQEGALVEVSRIPQSG